MSDVPSEHAEETLASPEISDEALEAAAFSGNAGVYTQMGLCTFSSCPG